MPGNAKIPGPGPRKYANEKTPNSAKGSKKTRIKDRENMKSARSRVHKKWMSRTDPWWVKLSDDHKSQFVKMAVTKAERDHPYTKRKELELRKEKKAKIVAEKAASNEALQRDREKKIFWDALRQVSMDQCADSGGYNRNAAGHIINDNGEEITGDDGRQIDSDNDSSVYTTDMSDDGWETRSQTSIIRGNGGEIDY